MQGQSQRVYGQWYILRACKIRSELPFIQLDQMTIDCFFQAYSRTQAFGGENNLWVEMQDSLGEYVTGPDGRIMNYKEFCTKIIDPWEHIWFIRLLDFYRDIHIKRDRELPRIVSALEQLVLFAKGASQPGAELKAA